MYATALVAAGLLAGANAAIVISNPVNGQTWYMNNSIALNWTAGPDDPSIFQVILRNDKNPGLLSPNPQQLAQQGTTADNYLGITLGHVQPGEGFTLQFANTTNASQIYADVTELKIEAGTPSTSTVASSASTSASSATSSSVNAVPNAPSQSPTKTSDPFAPSATESNSGSKTPAMAGAAAVLAVVAAALAL